MTAIGSQVLGSTWTVTQEQIDDYADVSEDHNPIHVDPAFAAASPYGRTIAHGLLTLGVLSEALGTAIGAQWSRGGQLEVKFVGAVFVGDEVAMTAVVTAVDGGRTDCDVRCAVGERVTVTGSASFAATSS